jgi:hypothetical protein
MLREPQITVFCRTSSAAAKSDDRVISLSVRPVTSVSVIYTDQVISAQYGKSGVESKVVDTFRWPDRRKQSVSGHVAERGDC